VAVKLRQPFETSLEEKKQAGYATIEKDLMETIEEEEAEEPEYDTGGSGGED
jgi:DNA-directed RNA polymerase subunit A'